ncbi:MAG TPA: YitT family protein [Candidatus Deferrimicrobium sp.]|nr:YitT family protein [Candidatus Deferrimicrobium sp.]
MGKVSKELLVSGFKRISGVALGAWIVALSLNYFIVPNRIVDGGVTGIAIIIHYVTNLPTGWMVLVLNVPIFLMGLKKMGGRFLLLSVVGVLTVSIAMEITTGVKPVTENYLLAAIFGGLLSGIGMGLIFRSQGSMGGTDIIALVINRRLNFSVGQLLLAIDAIIFLVAAVLFSPESAMYAIIYMFVATRVVDFVQEGLSHSKAAIIISSTPDEIAQDIMSILERGVTFLHGSGAYSGEDKKVIYCVVSRAELARVKEIVRNNDPDAFIALSEAPEVLGEGFAPVRGR